jgi:hypothetical protein
LITDSLGCPALQPGLLYPDYKSIPEFWKDTEAAKERKLCWMTKNKKDIMSSVLPSI